MHKLIITYFFLLIPVLVFSQERSNLTIGSFENQQDTVLNKLPLSDSSAFNSIIVDSAAIDSVVKPVIEAPIDYNAEDSIIVSLMRK